MKKKNDVKKRKQPPSYPALIRGGILISALIMTASLSFYMGPSVWKRRTVYTAVCPAGHLGLRLIPLFPAPQVPSRKPVPADRNKNRSRTRDSQEQTPRLSPTWKCHRNLDAWMT